jgi:predicted nucleotide-binding protein (sugar kinase/HSP70/actin superfamily)
MNPLEWIASGGILSVVIFSIATYVRTDKQINRVYERLDDKTEKLEQETVQQKVCDIVHKQVDKTLQEVKDRVECIPKIKAGIDLLLKQSGLKND